MYLLIIFIMLGSMIVGWMFKSRFQRYSEQPLYSGLSGAEVAERMLKDHNIHDVRIISTEGQLTDHYNPMEKTVNLSHDVYYGRSVAAAAVSAHEVGHAVQHATAYNWLMFRSRLVPAVSATSRYLPFILIGGILTLNIFPQLLLVGIILFALTTLFSFVTLPVEFDASRRALVWLQRTNITGGGEQQQMAATALRWAASTYVMSAVSSLATLLYYVMIFLGRRD